MIRTLILLSLLIAPTVQAETTAADYESLQSNPEFQEYISEYAGQDLDQEMIEMTVEGEDVAPLAEIEPVNVTTLKLLGRGIKPRRGKESLAVGCYFPTEKTRFEILDPECPALRFVWFKGPSEAYYIGSLMAAPKAPTAKIKKKALKVVLADFFIRHQTAASEEQVRKHFLKSFVLLVAASAAVGLSLPVTAAGTVVVSSVWRVFAVSLGIFFISTNVSFENYMVSGALLEAKFTQADGWNWIDNAKSIKPSKYRVILGQIVKGTRINYDHYNKEEKIRRQYNRIQKKGAEIGGPLGYY